MKSNKLLETLIMLDTLERKRFRNVIKNRKRDTLLLLYELCLSRIEKKLPFPEKEEVFQQLFKEKYKKENDFLLRNEYRLLTDEAEAFIRSAAVETQYPGICEAARLKYILQSGNASLFKKEFDSSSVRYKDDLMFWFAIDPNYLLYFITSEQMSIKHFDDIKMQIATARDRLGRLYNRFLSDYEVKKAYADKVHSVLSDTEIIPLDTQTVQTDTLDELVEYRKLKVQTYYTSGLEKIQILLDAKEILSKKKMPEFGEDEIWWIQANAGLEYYLQYDFKNAILHFDELFASPGIEKFNRLAEAALNYLSALMSTGEYEKAIQVISPFEQRIAASPPVFYKYICLKSLALLFLNKPQAARKELNCVEEHAIDFDFLYWRVTIILSFAVEKRWEEAQNEFRNLMKTKTIKSNTRKDLDNLVFVLDQLLKFAICIGNGKKVSPDAMKKCEEQIKDMTDNPGDFLHPPRLISRLLQQMKV
jgi:hypothetical protein